MRRSRTALLASTTAVLMTTLLGVSGAQAVVGRSSTGAASGGGPDAGLARFHDQPITWHACRLNAQDEVGADLDAAKAQCAEVTVPLDYAEPDGRTLTVAISRLKATDTDGRRGVLLTNPGGPGGPGLILPVVLANGAFAARYDVIGMDPRFVGRSDPINCGWPVSTWLGAGGDREGFARSVAVAKDLADRCRRTDADLLPHATTRNTARDMDVIRAALGEERLSYFGWSYGTYLGSVYLQLFGDRADRVVLDSAVDPDVFGPALLSRNNSAMTAALRNWAGWTARRHETYRLGSTTAQVLATVAKVRAAVDRRALKVGRYTVDDRLLPLLLWATGDADEGYADLAAAVRLLLEAARGVKVRPTASLEQFVTAITSPDVTGSASAQAAIICGDRAASRDPEDYRRDIRAHRTTEPLYGPLIRNITPCAFWPTEPSEPPTEIGNDVPALVLNATGDTQTPYAGAQALHRRLTGSRLVTLKNAYLHGVYFAGSTCADTAVDRYLRDGVLPTTDLTCTRDARPGTAGAAGLLVGVGSWGPS